MPASTCPWHSTRSTLKALFRGQTGPLYNRTRGFYNRPAPSEGESMHISAWSRHLTRLSGGAVLLAMGLVAGCENGTTPAQGGKKPKVIVTHPITGKVVDFQDFTGRLKAVKMVEIRARVSGYVTDIPFKEGDLVKEGDTLFQIDSRPYKADLSQTEANVKVAIADRILMQKNADRAAKMILNGSISREDYDAAFAAVDKSIATVGATEAARQKAAL